jgi:hypothetical protein
VGDPSWLADRKYPAIHIVSPVTMRIDWFEAAFSPASVTGVLSQRSKQI